MPRFGVAFTRRKSTADNIAENAAVAGPSFRVLDRSEVVGGPIPGRSFDAKMHMMPKPIILDVSSVDDDNIFAGLNNTRGSGSSNTTKTTSTDNSSRHSNASTAPSSAEMNGQDEWRTINRKPVGDINMPPKSSSAGFLRAAGRTFSFGGQKKTQPSIGEEPVPVPPLPAVPPGTPPQQESDGSGRARAMTASTTSTATPPRLEQNFSDLGGDFGKLVLGFDKRQSVATLRDDPAGRLAVAGRTLTGNRPNQPSPLHLDQASSVEAAQKSWNSQASDDRLLGQSPLYASPIKETSPQSFQRHANDTDARPKPSTSSSDGSLRRSSAIMGRRQSSADKGTPEDEESKLLESITAASKFLSEDPSTLPSQSKGRFRRNEDSKKHSGYRQVPVNANGTKDDDGDLFDVSFAEANTSAQRFMARQPSPPRSKVMTPAEFERYRKDKEREERIVSASKNEDEKDEEGDNYEEEEDDAEKSKAMAKQRRKQEAHMTVYRQQMMKVTGESSSGLPSVRPNMQASFSTPNLLSAGAINGSSTKKDDADSEDDEEVPLAILAAHGFPNRNRPPNRLSTMGSNPDLRAAVQTPSYQRPGSVMGSAAGGGPRNLPVFARNLPRDPYVGAGLVRNNVRESLALGGGSPNPSQPPAPAPPGGLVGVIASEERSRAMRRGSPDKSIPLPKPGVDPLIGVTPQMMYPMAPQPGMGMGMGMGMPPMLSPADQAQIQMTQQMQQFMQMQMQFMQMMATNQANGPQRPVSHMPNGSMSSMPGLPPLGGMGGSIAGPDMMGVNRASFMDNGSMMEPPRPHLQGRTMSMVQPSSASWIQPPPQQAAGYAPSIRIQGTGYAPSIAPSERSNIGLPGRYRPVSQMAPPSRSPQSPQLDFPQNGSPQLGSPQLGTPQQAHQRKSSTLSGVLSSWDSGSRKDSKSPLGKSSNDEDDDEEGWEAMKAKREKKKSMWKSKKSFGAELGSLIS